MKLRIIPPAASEPPTFHRRHALPWIDDQTLLYLFETERRTQRELAVLAGCHLSAIAKRLARARAARGGSP